jgi:hypothetical protein
MMSTFLENCFRAATIRFMDKLQEKLEEVEPRDWIEILIKGGLLYGADEIKKELQ